MTNIREIVYDTLLEYEKDKTSYVHIKDVLEKYAYLDKIDRSFLKRLIEGVIERKITLDYVLDSFSKIPTSKQKGPVRVLLRMGAYQILYMDSVPDSAAVNECVKLASKRHLSNLTGVINGILRNVSRNKNNLEWPNKATDVIEYLSVYYSCPKWIVKLLVDEQGEENACYVLENSVSIRPVTARINHSVADARKVDSVCGQLIECGDIVRSEIIDGAIEFKNVDNISDNPIVRDGLAYVQDIGSMLVCLLAGIKDTDLVLDVCASPGGKSLNAADLASKGKVISCDVTEKKVDRIRENVARCGFNNVETLVCDATNYHEEFSEIADVVIADVPCSGLGVMGRKNDIKYNLSPVSVDELALLSQSILSNVTRYLKPGGILMFSTCTVSLKENNRNMEYISESLGLEKVSFYDELPDALKCETAWEGYIQLYGKDGLTDGFFIAKFRK